MSIVARWRWVIALRRVLDRYGAAGGGLLAGGLAYAALFAIVPAVVLLAGVAGLVYADPVARAQAVSVLAGVLPPLRDLIDTVLAEAARDAAPVSVIGAVALVWGTSRFVVSFLDALGRVMGGDRRRGFLAQNLGALVAVVFMVAAIPASAALSAVADFLEAGHASGVFQAIGALLAVALQALPVLATIGAMILVYRVVPRPAPTWRATLAPGLTIGIVLTVVARIFAFLAPRLIGTAALIGTLATVFAALAWLALSFQAILVGAAWVSERDESIRSADIRRASEGVA
ncbi:MAG TPA: YihY/virulence factor BrkB family protein [Candidatus Limnocylindrales bacterium]|nr:YihY/virulence factor BrkB family protein [Candidatus Limnocylindrales bacterium]